MNDIRIHIIMGLTVMLVASLLMIGLTRAQAQNQSTYRDAGGRTVGTATTDSQGSTTYRDSSGRTTGTATGVRKY